MAKLSREEMRKRRHRRIRGKIGGTAERPRLNVRRTLQHIYVQVIDDVTGHTLVSASTVDKGIVAQMDGKSKSEQAALVGETVAQRAQAAGIETVTFDRGGYVYHGRVQTLAEAAREAGLNF